MRGHEEFEQAIEKALALKRRCDALQLTFDEALLLGDGSSGRVNDEHTVLCFCSIESSSCIITKPESWVIT